MKTTKEIINNELFEINKNKKWFSVEELIEAFEAGKNDVSLSKFKEMFGLKICLYDDFKKWLY